MKNKTVNYKKENNEKENNEKKSVNVKIVIGTIVGAVLATISVAAEVTTGAAANALKGLDDLFGDIRK